MCPLISPASAACSHSLSLLLISEWPVFHMIAAFSPCAFDVVVHAIGALDVANDCGATGRSRKIARENTTHQLVAPHDTAVLVVDRADPVGVAVVGNSDARAALLFTAAMRSAHVLLDRGVGMMVGKAAVHLDEKLDRLEVPTPRISDAATTPPHPLPPSTATLEARPERDGALDEVVVVANAPRAC